MNDYILCFLKSDYENRLNDKDKKESHIVKLLNAQYFLNQHPSFLKYIDFSDEIREYYENYQTNDDILDELVNEAINAGLLRENNNILFYAGTFMNDGKSIWQVPRDSIKGEYDLYLNIESCEQIQNPIENRSSFEGDHKIIFYKKVYPSMHDFRELKHYFFKSVMIEDQEEVCQRVLKRKF